MTGPQLGVGARVRVDLKPMLSTTVASTILSASFPDAGGTASALAFFTDACSLLRIVGPLVSVAQVQQAEAEARSFGAASNPQKRAYLPLFVGCRSRRETRRLGGSWTWGPLCAVCDGALTGLTSSPGSRLALSMSPKAPKCSLSEAVACASKNCSELRQVYDQCPRKQKGRSIGLFRHRVNRVKGV